MEPYTSQKISKKYQTQGKHCLCKAGLTNRYLKELSNPTGPVYMIQELSGQGEKLYVYLYKYAYAVGHRLYELPTNRTTATKQRVH
jgi:hypothetical protein